MMFLKKKKASLMVEFVAILPFMIICLWMVVNTMFYLNAQSTVHQAAIMAAEVTAQELRGHVVGADGLQKEGNEDIKDSVVENILRVITNTTKYNSLVTLGRAINEESIQIADCDKNTMPYICVASEKSEESNLSTGSGHDIITVHISADFNVIGGFDAIFRNLKVNGYGYATLAQSERFNYHQDYGEPQEEVSQ